MKMLNIKKISDNQNFIQYITNLTYSDIQKGTYKVGLPYVAHYNLPEYVVEAIDILSNDNILVDFYSILKGQLIYIYINGILEPENRKDEQNIKRATKLPINKLFVENFINRKLDHKDKEQDILIQFGLNKEIIYSFLKKVGTYYSSICLRYLDKMKICLDRGNAYSLGGNSSTLLSFIWLERFELSKFFNTFELHKIYSILLNISRL